MADAALLAEAYKRGLLPAQKAAAYEEGVRRGLIRDEFAAGRLSSKSGLAGAGAGFLATVNEAIPGGDELAAGMDTIGRVVKGQKLGEAWKGARDRQAGLMSGYREDHPVLSDLATGTGYAIQAVPALMTGGATVAPQAEAAAGKGLAPRMTKFMVEQARNATTGAVYGATNAMTGRGSVSERVRAADAAILPGATAGVVIPLAAKAAEAGVRAGVKAAGAVTRTSVRAANNIASKTAGGAFLDPQEEALNRLAEALQKDKLSASQVDAALSEWQRVGGPSPAFMDIVAKDGGGQNTMALVRGAAMSGAGRNEATKYGARVAADLQDTVIDRTRALTPDTRTIPTLTGDIERRIASSSTAPDVPAGSGGAQVHGRLNAAFDEANAGVNAAYGAARAAAPEAAHLPAAELPAMSANLREAVRDFHPADVPSVTRILDSIDSLSTPTLRDLYEARARLSSLRAEPGIQSAAAGRAVGAIDAQIQAAADRGAIAGDPGVVELWQAAIRARRNFGRDFQGNDLVAALTERASRGGERAVNAIPAEDASAAILGRNGVSPRPNMVRDLTRLRDMIGADSPEWHALRQEAVSRVLGRDAGSENFGHAWGRFSSQNPELAQLLMTPGERAALQASQGRIAGAVADRGAIEAGRGVMSRPADEHAAAMARAADRRSLAQIGAARELEASIERPAEGATGVLNRIANSNRSERNLAATFGDQPAADYRTAIGNAVEKTQNARFINPNTGAQTAGRLADETLVENIPTSKIGLVKAIISKVRNGVTLTDAERGALVRLATGEAGNVADRVVSRIKPPPVRMVDQRPMSPALAIPMTRQDQNR